MLLDESQAGIGLWKISTSDMQMIPLYWRKQRITKNIDRDERE